jgi:hypothetical protein
MVSIHITSKEYNTSYWQIKPTVYNFVNGPNHSYTFSYWQIKPTVYNFMNGYNHSYTFCTIFCSQMMLYLPGTVLPTQGIHTLGHTKIHML